MGYYIQDGGSFYVFGDPNDDVPRIVYDAETPVNGDSDLDGAVEARKEFIREFPGMEAI